jgi:hypothetical protein
MGFLEWKQVIGKAGSTSKNNLVPKRGDASIALPKLCHEILPDPINKKDPQRIANRLVMLKLT